MAAVEDEGATGSCDVEPVADDELGVQVAARGTVGFALDGDPVIRGAGRPGERVVAEHRALLRARPNPQREVLPRPRSWKSRAGGIVQADRDRRIALAGDRRDTQ